MKIIILILLAAAVAALGGCSLHSRPVEGAGPMVSRSFDTADFNALEMIGVNFSVVWRQSDETAVTIEMQENLFEHLNVASVGGTLRISSYRAFSTTQANTPRLYISSPQMSALSISGVANISGWDTIYGERFAINKSGVADITLNLEVERLELNSSGAGSIELSGRADIADITISGAGRLSALELQARDAVLNLSGVGGAEISAVDNLSVTITGMGSVRYRGNPALTQNITGMGTLSRIED